MKRIVPLILLLCMAVLLAGCNMVIESANGSADDIKATPITLNGDSASVDGKGAVAKGSVVTVSSSGSYSLTGKLNNGQIIVDTGDDGGLVTLILNNADITNASDAAILIRQAKDVTVYLAKNSVNTVTSGAEADMDSFDEESASGAAIYAEDDIDFDGSGVLNIYGYLNNGVTCKDDIDVNGGVINITSVNNGMRGSESVEINGGELNVEAGKDGIKSTKSDRDGKGYVSISGGVVTVNAKSDGISAEKELTISGGVITVYSGTTDLPDSGKGVKANTALTISGGELSVMSADHAIHSGAGITVSGGNISAYSSEGKGMAAHEDIEISGGNLSVASAKDGIASKANVTISGGTASAISGRDGVNAKGKLMSTGGQMIAVGNSKRIKSFDSGSTQGFFACSVSGAKGSTVNVRDRDNELWSLSSQWDYNTVICTSPNIISGSSYFLTIGNVTVEAIA